MSTKKRSVLFYGLQVFCFVCAALAISSAPVSAAHKGKKKQAEEKRNPTINAVLEPDYEKAQVDTRENEEPQEKMQYEPAHSELPILEKRAGKPITEGGAHYEGDTEVHVAPVSEFDLRYEGIEEKKEYGEAPTSI